LFHTRRRGLGSEWVQLDLGRIVAGHAAGEVLNPLDAGFTAQSRRQPATRSSRACGVDGLQLAVELGFEHVDDQEDPEVGAVWEWRWTRLSEA
jgi:hypothetical protein